MANWKDRRIWIAVVVVVVIVIVTVTRWSMSPAVPQGGQEQTLKVSPPPKSTTMAPVPTNVVVEDIGATGTPPDVAVPVIQGPSNQNDSSNQYRSYAIKIENGQFTPDTVILNFGDVMDLEVTAVDGNYDFTQPDYGFRVSIPQGHTQRVQGAANIKGKFTFYCASCGGPARGPVGYFIVK